MLQYVLRNHFQMGEMKDIYTHKKQSLYFKEIDISQRYRPRGPGRLSILINTRMRLKIGIYDIKWMAASRVSVFPRLLFKWPDAVLMTLFLEI